MHIRMMVSALLLAGAASPALAGKMILIGARGPSAKSFPVGMTFTATSIVTLLQKDRIIIVDDKGTRVFSGPGKIQLDRANTDAASRWKDIRDMVNRTRAGKKGFAGARTGGARGLDSPEEQRAGLWVLEWPKSGHYCFDASVGMIIHRSAQKGKTPFPADSFSFTDKAGGMPVEVKPPAGRALFLWPAKFLPAAGKDRSYVVTSGGRSENVTLSAVPVKELDTIGLAEFVTSRKCDYPLTIFADKADQMEKASQ